MATNFPTGTDVFNVPSSPGSTALSAAGTGSRNHVQHHRDLGDTIEAMEAEATLAIHSHDGTTARHGNKLLQANTHQSPDTDTAAGSIHHTLGHGANQAAPGNHASLGEFQDTHANSVSWPVGCIYISTSASNPSGALGGTWVQIQDAFLIGVGGSYSYSGSVVANSSSHSHTVADTSADAAHSHTLSGTINAAGTHGHTNGGSLVGTDVGHSHTQTNSGFTVSTSTADSAGFNATNGTASHTHTSTGGAVYDPGGSNHSHSMNDYNGVGDHGHTISSGTSTSSTHSHTSGSSSTAHLPSWKAFYVWRRTA